MRLWVCIVVAAACAALLSGAAGSARAQGGADWTLRPVADGQKWLRVDVSGDTLYGFRVRGTDFAVTGIKSVRASGGPTPQCSISGTPATLSCDGELPGGDRTRVGAIVPETKGNAAEGVERRMYL